MQQINELIGRALTATLEPQMQAGLQATEAPIPRSFASFDTCGDRCLEAALTESVRFVRGHRAGDKPRWLSLVGASGTGKTMLAKCIAEALAVGRKSESATIWMRAPIFYWPAIADQMKSGEWQAASRIAEPPLAIIDDIGAEHDPSRAIASALSRVLDRRLDKWTVLTSNLTLEQIGAQIDTRISSRMIRGHNIVVEMVTTDFNLR